MLLKPESRYFCDSCKQTYDLPSQSACRHLSVLHKVESAAAAHENTEPPPNLACECVDPTPYQQVGRAVFGTALETILNYWFPFRAPDFYDTLLMALEHFRTRALWIKRCEIKGADLGKDVVCASVEEYAGKFEFCFGAYGHGQPEVMDVVISWICKAMGAFIEEAALEYTRVQNVTLCPPRFESHAKVLSAWEMYYGKVGSIKEFMDMHYFGRLG
ncbi:hypothetical protein BDV98DRAFT_600239 [Pterulicium gracile]|uniref:Uncharacterized protein n=1 Tax=Pterulicium gracile TaxID=1884261 RepID=A0A5C3R0R2_9AGAR|nr:hypothetical protein BDV98DRAFT_600239 [Pterula gracilis]